MQYAAKGVFFCALFQQIAKTVYAGFVIAAWQHLSVCIYHYAANYSPASVPERFLGLYASFFVSAEALVGWHERIYVVELCCLELNAADAKFFA